MATMPSNPVVSLPREIGITVLHEGTPSIVDIVCIHGLNSTSGRCWEKDGVLWLRDLLPKEPELTRTRIITFGYNSNVLEAASAAGIRDHAIDLLQGLLDDRERKDKEAQSRRIIFVCHSLGGIVAKQAMVMANQGQADRFKAIGDATFGIIFLGTPHRGSELASLGQILARIAKFAFKKPSTRLLKSLKGNSGQLQDLSEEFSKLHSLFQIVSCYEQKTTSFGKGPFSKSFMVVPETSAKLVIEGEIHVPMNTDHHDICKFGDADDPGYIKVKNRIVELVNKSVALVRFESQHQIHSTGSPPTEAARPAGGEFTVVTLRTIYNVYRSCNSLFSIIRNYTKCFKRCQKSLFLQENLFAHECKSILHMLVENDVAAAMLKDEDHSQWRNPVFREEWSIIGTFFSTPLEISREVLESIEEKLLGFYINVIAKRANIPLASLSSLSSMSDGVEDVVQSERGVLQLVEKLKVQNEYLGYLRKQQRPPGESAARPQERRSNPPDPKAISTQLLAIREVAKRVYDGLVATAGCPCHRVNLRLQGQLDEPDSGLDTNHTDCGLELSLRLSSTIGFRFIVTKNTEARGTGIDSEIQYECTCITINSELQPCVSESLGAERSCPTYIEPGEKRFKFTIEGDENRVDQPSTVQAISTSLDGGEAGATPMDIGPAGKKAKLKVRGKGKINERSSTSINTSASAAEIDAAEINNLCSLLATLQPGKHARELLGRIPHQGCNPTYQHLVYRDPPVSHVASRYSLEMILAHPNKQILLPRIERLKIAIILSLSLLHFGSYSASWFQERWRSRDIFFFLELQQQQHGNALDPYVVPYFPTSDEDTSINENIPTPLAPPRGVARNEQLLSLALVLIEIAFGKSLLSIYEPAQIPENRGDDIVEYMKAKSILESSMLEKEMGPRYADVVSRCLFCDFGIRGVVDLSKRDFQEIFYKDVICELRRCLKSFEDVEIAGGA